MGIQTSTINGGPVSGFKNKIINGNFSVWQRGTSLVSGNGLRYLADRWFTNANGSNCTPSLQTFTVGQSDVPDNPTYWHRVVTSSVAGSGNYVILQQNIEGVSTFAGQQVTVSFWAKADTTRSVSVSLDQYFGSGGSPSARVNGSGTKYTLTASWQKITYTYTVPSISGKTLGSNSDDYLVLNLWLDAGSTLDSRTGSLGQQSGTFDFALVQVEQGPIATTFEQRPSQVEIALCQRYYVGGLLAYLRGYVGSGTVFGLSFLHPQTMRALPTYTEVTSSSSNIATSQFGYSSTKQGYVYASGITIGGPGTLSTTFNASAEL